MPNFVCFWDDNNNQHDLKGRCNTCHTPIKSNLPPVFHRKVLPLVFIFGFGKNHWQYCLNVAVSAIYINEEVIDLGRITRSIV